MEKKLIVFIDCGDTLVDESTQVMADNGDVLRADLIEGAGEMLDRLRGSGYRLALVADGRLSSFRNIFRSLGRADAFETRTISEELGAEKPDPRMFRTAMDRMGLTEADASRIVMIGNNLKRDILGANRMGICSVLLSFSPRYGMQPETAEEVPDYVVAMPREIPPLLDQLERQIENKRILTQRPS